ncbi:MAG: transcriptional regulator [Spirochaetes bacterium]|nr:MAG: transcriptional regulator [Spirochaetota bacterium]
MSGNDEGKCKVFFVHEDTVRKVKKEIPKEETLFDLADFFKIFGDTTRIRILSALFITEMCVCDLSEILGVSQSAMSHQLKILRQAGLVKFRKEGKSVFYSLKDEHVKQIIDTGIAHISE